MQYIDSGSRVPAEAVATWLLAQMTPQVSELRWQSGFFSADGLHPFVTVLQRMASANLPVHALIGSNEGETLEAHALHLVSVLGIPRSNARLGIVNFAGATYFHPKIYHLRRNDGSQAAYVGSANLTLPGLTGQHVEAGLIVDTAQGDPNSILDQIADGVDSWFSARRPGLEVVTSAADISRLTAAGILAVAPTPRAPSPTAGSTNQVGAARPRLSPLVQFPRGVVSSPPRPPITGGATGTPPTSGAARIPPAAPGPTFQSVPRSPYPPYLLFAPNATSPTVGATALTGANLPAAAQGLIIRLNRDSARHWNGGTGTSNISIPVATLGTLRFGIYNGARPRPRCEFALEMRFIFPGNQLRAYPGNTNVMAYGFSPGDTGHGDVRFVVPKPPASELERAIRASRQTMPTDGHVAFLEWPTPANPVFRLSLLEATSPLYQQASAILASSAPVGGGACWLPAGLSPAW